MVAPPRRTSSSCDLQGCATGTSRALVGACSSDSLESFYEDVVKPIKRSRSDQSLSATAQAALSAAAAAGGGGRGGWGSGGGGDFRPAAQPVGPAAAGLGGALQPGPGLGKGRLPSLPVVLSDMGSSTNSLLSLDSDPAPSSVPGSAAQLAGAAAVAAATLSCGTPPAAPLHATIVLSPGDAALLRSLNKRSSGALYSLHQVSSAASLGPELDRTASDGSAGSGGYLAALQQLVPPLPAYSPPPLFSPGPPPLPGSSSSGSLSAALRGGSILLRKQAAFVAPVPAGGTAPGARGMARPGEWGGTGRHSGAICSVESIDSIASAEAGEHALSAALDKRSPRSPGTVVAFGAALPSPAAAPGGSGTGNGTSRQPQQQQQQQQAAPSGNAGASSRWGAAAKSPALPPPAPSSSRPAQQDGGGGARPPTGALFSSSSAPPASGGGGGGDHLRLRDRAQQHQQQQQLGARASTDSLQLSDSPAIELQGMGSMIGNEGEQWLLPEVSTGAIGFVPLPGGAQQRQTEAPAADGPSAAPSQQQMQMQQHMQAQMQAQTQAVASAPCVPTTAAAQPAAATSHWCAAAPAVASAGTFGFGAAAAAAGAKLRMFGGGPLGAGGPGGASGGPAAAAAAARAFVPQPAAARSAVPSVSSSPGASWQAQKPPVSVFAAASAVPASSGAQRAQQGMWSAPLPGMPPSSAAAAAAMPGRAGAPRPGFAGDNAPAARAAAWLASPGPFDYPRRPASFDCSRPGARRRGSLELNMPWRSRLDAVIAQAAAEAPQSPQSARSTATDMSGASSGGAGSGVGAGASAAAAAAADPFGDDDGAAAGALPAAGWRQAPAQHGSGLDLLLPAPAPQPGRRVVSLAELGAAARAGRGGAAGRGSSDGSEASAPVSSSSSSGASVAADHDLPGSTNLGGYIGGSDAIATASAAALCDLAARAYGLEFDGAMLLQPVDSSQSLEDAAMGAAAAAAVQQQQQQHAGGGGHLRHHRHGLLTPEQEQELARIGSPTIESRLRLGVTAHQQQRQLQQQQHSAAAAPPSPPARWQEAPRSPSPSPSPPPSPPQVHRHKQEQVVVVEVEDGDHDGGSPQPLASPGRAGGSARSASNSPPPRLGPGALHTAASAASALSSDSSRESPGHLPGAGRGRGVAGADSGGSAAYELFVRLNRARQTLDFAKRQAQAFAELDKAELGVWEALDLLNSLREYEAVLLADGAGAGARGGAAPARRSFSDEPPLTPDMPLKEHALQVAELCRLSFPDKPWMALVGLLHGLGKLLAHPSWGSQPQWAVAGESFPVGCRFAPQIGHSEFFSANPDRRRRTYSTALGVYGAGCGLRNVYMSWGAPEYLYMALVLNNTALPDEALFLLRYQRCAALTRPGGAYRQLMTEGDRAMLPLLAAFQGLVAYRRVQLPPEALSGAALAEHYDRLIATYLGDDKLFW